MVAAIVLLATVIVVVKNDDSSEFNVEAIPLWLEPLGDRNAEPTHTWHDSNCSSTPFLYVRGGAWLIRGQNVDVEHGIEFAAGTEITIVDSTLDFGDNLFLSTAEKTVIHDSRIDSKRWQIASKESVVNNSSLTGGAFSTSLGVGYHGCMENLRGSSSIRAATVRHSHLSSGASAALLPSSTNVSGNLQQLLISPLVNLTTLGPNLGISTLTLYLEPTLANQTRSMPSYDVPELNNVLFTNTLATVAKLGDSIGPRPIVRGWVEVENVPEISRIGNVGYNSSIVVARNKFSCEGREIDDSELLGTGNGAQIASPMLTPGQGALHVATIYGSTISPHVSIRKADLGVTGNVHIPMVRQVCADGELVTPELSRIAARLTNHAGTWVACDAAIADGTPHEASFVPVTSIVTMEQLVETCAAVPAQNAVHHAFRAMETMARAPPPQ